jgi:YD repeat-containing protein
MLEKTGSGSVLRKTIYVYHPNTAANTWIIDQPAVKWVRDGADNLAACMYWVYDGQPDYGYAPLRGNPTSFSQVVTDSPLHIITDTIEYDSNHYYVPINQIDDLGSVTHVEYDDAWLRPTSITKAYSTPLALTTNYAYGASGTLARAQGLVTSVTDPNSQVTTYAYDYFGRLTRVVRPGDSDSQPTLEYAYFDTELPLRISAASASPRAR